LHPDDRQFVQDAVNACIDNGEEYNIQHRIVWPDGSVHWIAAQGNVVRNSLGEVERMLGMAQDITQRKQIEEELLTQGQIITNMQEGAILISVSDHSLVYTNPAFEKMFGYELGEMLGKHVSIINAPTDISPENIAKKIISELQVNGVWRGEVHHVKKDGSLFWASVTVSTFGHPVYGKVWLSVHADISERKIMLEQLSYQASHDGLTGLISRYEFEKRVTLLLSSLSTEPVEHAMCFLDLDQFKVINDTCGHAAGDELLRQLGKVLGDTVRKQDTLARLGGDEFGVLMEHCTLEQASRTANNILEAVLEHQFFWDDKTFRIGVSIGLVAMTQNSGNFTDLLRQADAACYLAKDLGRNRIHTYHPDDTELAIRHGEMQWVGRISEALDNDRFCLYAQAIVALNNDSHRHYEILVRMLDEERGIIPPGAFLPAAERYNLIERLDAWVVANTCAFLEKHAAFTENIDFVSINLSGRSLTNEKFLASIIRIFEETGISPRKVCFEITETAAVSNMDSAIKFVKSLRAIGCQFALDDFGSGISSFGYLKSLPVDYLKIDGMFVKDIADDRIDYAMVKSINEIGQVMGMKTIAEFVENDEIKLKLKTLGVNYAQGYGIGKPQPLENLVL
jgi:diguanylate cyclase (GGDEF)-like protein/PAS domain S-box-containing protein